MAKYVYDGAGNLREFYPTINRAIKSYAKYLTACGEKLTDDTECSLGVAIDDEGNKVFCVTKPFVFTNCEVRHLEGWQYWYNDEWLLKTCWQEE